MKRRDFLKLGAAGAAPLLAQSRARRPNFVVIFLDDAGYGDIHPFGKPSYATPNIQRLAERGCRFTNFYVPQAVCSASRAALLTGCYPERVKMFGAHGPRARGVEPQWSTMGEVFQRAGYRTAVFGKWHIGDQEDTRPPARGFHESCGLMYSNDMWEFHPERPQDFREPLQYWDNGRITIERVTPKDQETLTQRYTSRAVDFIRKNRAGPFLLYVPHSMPHVPLFCSEKFRGRSGAGLYGDVMQELDWSVGEVVKALRDARVEQDTVVLFTSDNGPWTVYGNHAGVTPFREAKGTSFDGGTRSPCIVSYPGRIRAGTVSSRAWCTIDVLPTFASLAGAPLPPHPVDGKNLWDLIRGAPGAVNPHEYYPFTTNRVFEGLMTGDGRWKLHLPHPYRVVAETGNDGRPGRYRQDRIGLSLYDLQADPFEKNDVSAQHPEITARLQKMAERHQGMFFSETP